MILQISHTEHPGIHKEVIVPAVPRERKRKLQVWLSWERYDLAPGPVIPPPPTNKTNELRSLQLNPSPIALLN